MEGSINSQDVIGRDPFGRFLAFLKLLPWHAALASFSIFAIYQFALPAFFGVLFPREGLERSSLLDRVNQVGFLLVHPVVIYYYVWQPKAVAGLYQLVLPLAPASKQDELLRISRISHRSSRAWILGVLFGGVVVFLGVNYVLNYIGLRWYSFNWLMVVILQLSRFLLFYMIIAAVARHLTLAFNLNRVYQHIKLPVLIGQSKFSASFDAITGYGLSFAVFGGALGFFIAMRFFLGQAVFPEDTIYLLFYLVLVPLAFSLPFWQAHANMRLSRTEALRNISDALQDEYDRLVVDLSTLGNAEMPSERINTLRSLLEMTEKAPTWPFENSDLYRLFAATILPFIMTGVGMLVDLFF